MTKPTTIREKTERVERRLEFMNTAERRHAEIVASGKTVSWNEMHRCLKRLLAGAIVRHASGVLDGGADPRSDGCVAAY